MPAPLESYLFTSEAVGEGHPDKFCDQVSDAILDACLRQDPLSRVACETAAKGDNLVLLGEITSKAQIDYDTICRDVARRIGFTTQDTGFDAENARIQVIIEAQSHQIAGCVHEGRDPENFGAGDQGIMFGYASDETPECMPASHMWAQLIVKKLAEMRHSGEDRLRPDVKSQVTVEYKDVDGHTIPQRVHTVLVSTQHVPGVEDQLEPIVMEAIRDSIPQDMLDDKTIFLINPSGHFSFGGPGADAGLTGRKIIVDTYGGWGAHGGGAFSGKDSTKVDRSAAYAARWVALSLVRANLCRRCLVQLSYAIGVTEPLSIFVNTFGTGRFSDERIVRIVNHNFDLRPGAIIRDLGLDQPIFEATACFGHFGRPEFSWEQPKQLDYHGIE